jgi:hypothetical protein
MPFFRKKQFLIEAFRLGDRGKPTPAPYWFGNPNPSSITEEGIIIPTPEGDRLAQWGDWIIRGDQGKFVLCKPDVFEATYELLH